MDRMSPLDATFLHVEDGISHMHIASCAIFEGPAPDYDELVALIRSKLPLVPRYRQRVRFVPGGLGRPVWVDDPHFRIEYHVRHTALPSPGSDDDLRTLMGRLMSQELDRHRPLWETWVVEGLADGTWAMISKVHHCMVDGVSGTDLMAVVLDPSPDGSSPIDDEWEPEPAPTDTELVRDAIAQTIVNPNEMALGAVVLAYTAAAALECEGHRVRRRGAGSSAPAERRIVDRGDDRPPPAVDVGEQHPGRREADPRRRRGNGQRRRARGDHSRLP